MREAVETIGKAYAKALDFQDKRADAQHLCNAAKDLSKYFGKYSAQLDDACEAVQSTNWEQQEAGVYYIKEAAVKAANDSGIAGNAFVLLVQAVQKGIS